MFAAFLEFRGEPIEIEEVITEVSLNGSEENVSSGTDSPGSGFPQIGLFPGFSSTNSNSGGGFPVGGSSSSNGGSLSLFNLGGSSNSGSSGSSTFPSGLFLGSSGSGGQTAFGGFGSFQSQASTSSPEESAASSSGACTFKAKGKFCFSGSDCCSGVCSETPFFTRVCT